MDRSNIDEESSNTKISRRRIIQSLGAGGLALRYVSGIGNAKNHGQLRVPKVLSGDDVVEWMEIPKEWWQHHNRVKKANRRFKEKMFQNNGVVGCGMIRSPERYGEKHGFQLEITVDPERFSREIPDRFEGVPVVRNDTTRYEPVCYNESNYDSMPGGVWTRSDLRGTSCCKVKYNGNTYMLTAAHLFGHNCSGYDIGESAYQNSQIFGTLEGYFTDYDLAIVKPRYNDVEVNDNIEGESNNWDIKGYASEPSIATRVISPFDSYRKMGTSTGITTGGIGTKDYSIDHCFDFNNEGVRGGANVNDGDSGGPAFSVDDDGQATMLYTVSWGEDTQNDWNSCTESNNYGKCAGTAAYRTNNLGWEIVS